MLVESFGSGVVALPPLWDPSISGPAPQHNMPVAIGLFVLFLLLSFGVLRGIITKAIPLVGLARSGQRAQGTVVDRAPPKDLRRSSTIPVIEFTSLDGQRVRFSDVFAAKSAALSAGRALVVSLQATPAELARQGVAVNQDGVRRSAADLLRYPDIDLAALARLWPELGEIAPEIAEQLEIDGKYAGYLGRQEADIRAFRKDESLALPDDLDIDGIGSLSAEIRQKLRQSRPATLGAAARIPGMTPAALVALLRHVKRRDVVSSGVAAE